MINRFKFHLLIVWTIFILFLTLMPVPDIGIETENYYDKIVHLFLFGIFSYLLYLNLSFSRLKRVATTIFVSVIFSIIIEFFQYFVPGRNPSYLDFWAGFVGVLMFIIVPYVKDKK